MPLPIEGHTVLLLSAWAGAANAIAAAAMQVAIVPRRSVFWAAVMVGHPFRVKSGPVVSSRLTFVFIVTATIGDVATAAMQSTYLLAAICRGGFAAVSELRRRGVGSAIARPVWPVATERGVTHSRHLVITFVPTTDLKLEDSRRAVR
jgi:hypothetical protein